MSSRWSASLLPLVTAILLAGCWTPPLATVQPKGAPRLVQKGIVVESAMRPVIVQAVDARARTIDLNAAGGSSTRTYRAISPLAGFDHIAAGQKAAASFMEELTIYVPPQAPAPDPDPEPSVPFAKARVLSVDPSYRLLTLEYSDGWRETVKVGRDANLAWVEPGDEVTIKLLEVVALAAHKPWWR